MHVTITPYYTARRSVYSVNYSMPSKMNVLMYNGDLKKVLASRMKGKMTCRNVLGFRTYGKRKT